MYAGIRDACGGEGIYSSKLGRDFRPIDLIRLNMAEVFPLKFEDRKLWKRPGTGL
ncbi:hypothetical protein ACFL43_04695 [Thermodesulfobacteriota bacterium]